MKWVNKVLDKLEKESTEFIFILALLIVLGILFAGEIITWFL